MCSICFCMCMVINVTIIIITIITTTANIIITMHLQSCKVMLLCAAYGHRQGPPCIAWTDRWRKHPDFALQVTRAQFRLHLQPSSFWTPWKTTKKHYITTMENHENKPKKKDIQPINQCSFPATHPVLIHFTKGQNWNTLTSRNNIPCIENCLDFDQHGERRGGKAIWNCRWREMGVV